MWFNKNITQRIINYFRNFHKDTVKRIAQPYSIDQDSLTYWRSRILFAIIMTGWILGTIAIIASIGLFIREKAWGLALLDMFCFVLCAVLIFSNRIRYEVRTSIALLLFYAIGVTVILSVGPLSGGAAWLFSFVALVAVLLGLGPALIAVSLNAFSLSVIAWLISTGKIGHNFLFFETPQLMISTGVNFIVLNIIVAISVAVLVKGLISTHEKEKELTRKLEQEQAHLIKTKQNLEGKVKERLEMEQWLLDSEAKYRLLAENAKDVIWVRDMDMKLKYVSPSVEKVRGFTPEEAMAQSIEEVLTPESAKKALHLFSRLYQVKDDALADQYLVELEHRCKNGQTVWLELRLSWMHDKNDERSGILGVSRDITERKQLEDQLRQSHKLEAIGTLTGGVAHDFNNILSIITGNTELALDDIPENNPALFCLENIRIASSRAAGIIRQLLNFSRKTNIELQPLRIIPIIKDVLKFLRSTIPSNIKFKENIPQEGITVLTDPVQINQVMMNLCINAYHEMEEIGGTLEITVTGETLDDKEAGKYPGLTEGDYVKLMVSDTGHGIDPAIFDKIFDPYFTTKETGKGSGMGLAVVHGIVKNHNGAITVDSEQGKGTTFTILFPIVSDKFEIETKTMDELPLGKETILFIDDEESIANMTERMLKRLGYQVLTRMNPVEGLELFHSKPERFDLVITDMTMPQMTGVEFFKKLTAIRPGIPVIICTGHSALIDEEKAKEMGVAAYIMKPVVKKEMAMTIRNVLNCRD